MDKLYIPAERWERYAEAYSAHLVAEHKGKSPAPVRTIEHGAFLYTAFSVIYGRLGGSHCPTVQGWRLMPLSLYRGETTMKHHDEEAIEAGRRERGDKTGVIVSVRGQHMVCADRVDFCMTVPSTKPIPLEHAKRYCERESHYGWRALLYKGAEVEWFTLQGHPVSRHVRDDESCVSVLYWGKGDKIHDQTLDDDMQFDPVTEQVAVPRPAKAIDIPQLAFAF